MNYDVMKQAAINCQNTGHLGPDRESHIKGEHCPPCCECFKLFTVMLDGVALAHERATGELSPYDKYRS